MRAYYTSVVNFDDFTDSRARLDIFSAIEPATSVIVASSLVLGPVMKKWFGRAGYLSQPKRKSPSPKSTKHSFRRINDSTTSDTLQDSQDIELGATVTKVQVPTLIAPGSSWEGDGRMKRGCEDLQQLAVQEGRAISVQKDFSVYGGP